MTNQIKLWKTKYEKLAKVVTKYGIGFLHGYGKKGKCYKRLSSRMLMELATWWDRRCFAY